MNTRIKELRKNLSLSQKEFSERINVSENFVWMIEKGTRIPSDRTISDICREFRVREEWLRTGEGKMELDTTEREKLSTFFADVLASAPDERSAFVAALADLPDQFWPLVAELARSYAENLNAKEEE